MRASDLSPLPKPPSLKSTIINTKATKKQLAAEARQRGEKTFTARCRTHGEQQHYSSSGKCTECARLANIRRIAKRAERYRTDDEYRAAISEYHREWRANRKATNPDYAAHERAKSVNKNAIKRMREQGRPETALPTSEQLQDILELIKLYPPIIFDHIVPLKGLNEQREWVVCGLHRHFNLQPTTKDSNLVKLSWFNPEVHPEQRPCNGSPGGQYYGEQGVAQLEKFLRMDIPIYAKTETLDELLKDAI